MLNGSKGHIDLVILLKITETGQHTEQEYPWGETPERLSSMDHAGLVAAIDRHYATHNLRLVGKLSATVFLYPKGRKTRPKRAVFAHPHPGQTHQKALKFAVKGHKFDFPAKEAHAALERGVASEKTRRVLKHLKDARLLLAKP